MNAHKMIEILQNRNKKGFIGKNDTTFLIDQITNSIKFEFAIDVETEGSGGQWIAFTDDFFSPPTDVQYQMPFPLCYLEVPKLGVVLAQQSDSKSEINVTLFLNYRQGWGLHPPKYNLILDLKRKKLVSKSSDFALRAEFDSISDKLAIFNILLFKGLTALNCSNVVYIDNKPDEALNKKRQKNGKVPLFTYKTLHIDNETKIVKPHQGGTHASPRLHLRRGHVRHYATHSVWIEDMLVGDPSKGFVAKDYNVATF